MKRKMQPEVQQPQGVSSEAQAQKEIDNFFAALNSYAACAAEQPHLSFEKHLVNICASEETRAARTRRG